MLFKLSFNISFGLPSVIRCTLDSATILLGRGIVLGVDYEVIRSQYISSSQPDTTRLSFYQRIAATYQCNVTVEGHQNIASGNYDFDVLGSGTSSITVTGE